MRLEIKGIKYSELPSDYFVAIEHDNLMRGLESNKSQDPKVKARWIYKSYLKFKYDYFISNNNFPEIKERNEKMQEIKLIAEKKSYNSLKKITLIPTLPSNGVLWPQKIIKKTFVYNVYLYVRSLVSGKNS